MKALRLAVVVAAAGCQFQPGRATQATDAPAADAPRSPDAPVVADAPLPPDALSLPLDVYAPAALCGGAADVPFCLNFDQVPLTSPLPNLGTASDLRVTLTNVTQIAGGSGGSDSAALLGSASTMVLPPMGSAATELPTIGTIEMWLRIDADPVAPHFRSGLLDVQTSASGMSLFLYLIDGQRKLRCVIGSDTIYSAPLEIGPGSWHYAACTCDTETSRLSLYFDGQLAGALPQCAPGAVDVAGLTIGQNNNGSAGPPDDPLVGAIDGVRFTRGARTPNAICKLAGRPDCE